MPTDERLKALKAAGAKRVMPLPVSAPFHCALMQPAEARLAPEQRKVVENALRDFRLGGAELPPARVERPHRHGKRLFGLEQLRGRSAEVQRGVMAERCPGGERPTDRSTACVHGGPPAGLVGSGGASLRRDGRWPLPRRLMDIQFARTIGNITAAARELGVARSDGPHEGRIEGLPEGALSGARVGEGREGAGLQRAVVGGEGREYVRAPGEGDEGHAIAGRGRAADA